MGFGEYSESRPEIIRRGGFLQRASNSESTLVTSAGRLCGSGRYFLMVRLRPIQQQAYALFQLGFEQWLHGKVTGTGIEVITAFGHLVQVGKQQDRHVPEHGAGSQFPDEVHAAQVGHGCVSNDYIGVVAFFKPVNGFQSVIFGDELIGIAQDCFHRFRNGEFHLDH